MREKRSFAERTRVLPNDEVKKKYFLVYEGKDTEAIYFEAVDVLREHISINPLIEVIPVIRSYSEDGWSNPKKILDRMIKNIEELKSGEVSYETLLNWIMDYFHDYGILENNRPLAKSYWTTLQQICEEKLEVSLEEKVDNLQMACELIFDILKEESKLENIVADIPRIINNSVLTYSEEIDKNANSISIVKRRMYLKSVSVFENPYSQKALIEETELDALATALSTSYIAYNYDVNENCLYIFSSANYYINTNGAFQITRIKLSDWSIRQWTMTNTTNEQLNTNGMRFAFADNGFVYLKGYNSPYEIYKFEIGNSANVVKIKRNGMGSNDGLPMYAMNGRIYYQTSSSNSSYRHIYILNTETETILKTENFEIYNCYNMPCYTPVLNHPMLLYCSFGNYTTSTFFIPANYLATINNLSEPVTKTADKTMKITYTIQEQ